MSLTRAPVTSDTRSRSATRSSGFAPLAGAQPQVLVLGSLPSVASIREQQYYAHPRNAFWPIMAELCAARGSYAARCQRLTDAGIAVWDVLASSVRPGSLDAAIQMSSAEVNNFADFFDRHGDIHRICFNGQKAARIFRARVPPAAYPEGLQLLTLPSTSPAHAAMPFATKLELWGQGTGLSHERP